MLKQRAQKPSEVTIPVSYTKPSIIASVENQSANWANLKCIKLKVYLRGHQLPHFKIGQTVQVRIGENYKENRTVEGVIDWISSIAEFILAIIHTKK